MRVRKRDLIYSLAYLLPLLSMAQINYNWVPGKIELQDTTITGLISFDTRSQDGAVLLKDNDRILTFGPNQVDIFQIENPDSNDQMIIFESVVTERIERNRKFLSFQRLIYGGQKYGLYHARRPNLKKSGYVLPLPGILSFGVVEYIKVLGSYYLHFDGEAKEISKKKGSDYNRINIDKKRLFLLVGDKKDALKKYMKEENIRLRTENDLVLVTKFLNQL